MWHCFKISKNDVPGIKDAGNGIRTRGLTVSQVLVRALLFIPYEPCALTS